jgi:hypothetical protein
VHFTIGQVQPVVLVILGASKLFRIVGSSRVGGSTLGEGVAGTEVCNKLSRVFGSVDSEGLWNGKERCGEGSNGQLFTGTLN